MRGEEMSLQQRRTEIAELLGRAMRRMQQRAVAREKNQLDDEIVESPTAEIPSLTTAGGAHE